MHRTHLCVGQNQQGFVRDFERFGTYGSHLNCGRSQVLAFAIPLCRSLLIAFRVLVFETVLRNRA